MGKIIRGIIGSKIYEGNSLPEIINNSANEHRGRYPPLVEPQKTNMGYEVRIYGHKKYKG